MGTHMFLNRSGCEWLRATSKRNLPQLVAFAGFGFPLKGKPTAAHPAGRSLEQPL
jgi:hypothetical protein